MFEMLDKDLSIYSEEDLKIARKFLYRAWKKPFSWHLIIPALIAIKYELEWREAVEKEYG